MNRAPASDYHFAPSIHRRHLAISLVAALLLVLAGIGGQQALDHAEARSLRAGRDLHAARRATRRLMRALWQVQDLQEQRLLIPGVQPTPSGLRTAWDRLQRASKEPWARSFGAVSILIAARDDLRTLRGRLYHLQKLRANPNTLYPAFAGIHHSMYPMGQIVTQTLVALQARLERDPSLASAPETLGVAQTLAAWSAVIADFRLRMAFTRMLYPHTLPPTLKGSPTRAYRAFERKEQALLEIARRAPGYPDRVTLMRMEQAARLWHGAMLQVLKTNQDPMWRSDLVYLRTRIHPVVTDLWQRILQLQALATTHSRKAADHQIATIRTLSHYLWLLAGFALAKILFTIMVLERSVRRPMARVAEAMQAEALGLAGPPLPASRMREPLQLIAAFQGMQHQVHNRQQRLEAILDNAAEGIVTFSDDGLIESSNHTANRLLGYLSGEAVGLPLRTLLDLGPGPAETAFANWIARSLTRHQGREIEVAGLHRDGGPIPLCARLSRAVLESGVLYTALLSDVTERKATLARLQQLAERDQLTGLFNRIYLEMELDRVVDRTRRHAAQHHALIYLDLDNFKYVNETLGHAAGDHLLLDVTSALKSRTRKSDLLARFGGDEFAVLLYDTDPEHASQVADTFRRHLAEYRFGYEGKPVDIRVSIGVSLLSATSRSGAEALSQADMACHQAKHDGKNRVHVFASQDQDRMARMSSDLTWAHRIREGLAHDHFVLVAQPILDLESGTIQSHELLVRLADSPHPLILPGLFLPIAERFGLSVELDKWVIAHALALIPALAGTDCYAINLSGHSASDPSMLPWIAQHLQQSGVAPQRLTFELTETVAVADMEHAQAFMEALSRLGCRTALDDFGSGFSSFAYLKDLPVHTLKIDGRFVRNAVHSAADEAILRAMNEIAHALGKWTVAEFVEDEATLTLLRQCGVDAAQGYYIGRPERLEPSLAEKARVR